MQRHKADYLIAAFGADEIKRRMLNWANQFSILLFLDNNSYPSSFGQFECLLATGSGPDCIIDLGHNDPLSRLQNAHDIYKDWLFGHLCYDYKNIVEPKLFSTKPANTGYPVIQFFIPEVVCYVNKGQTLLTIESFGDPEKIYDAIMQQDIDTANDRLPALQFTSVVPKETYLQTIQKLRAHIADGDCYEINFCNEGYCENAAIVPAKVFKALNKLSPAPFAAYYRLNDLYLMCTSPERYLSKKGNRLIAQPIKGTSRRDTDLATDLQRKEQLRNNIKERAENVMIVDLLRNDLARCCETGSVHVDELFGIYSFPQVHQMISTISGTLQQAKHFTDAIRYSFPMGSMTGAPKYKVMQLIEHYERSRRELFSGTVGYITPDGDFDFNVIIRSLFYNAATKYLSYQTGGAITYDSDPEQEWEEMRLKAWAMERIFE